MYMYVHLWYCRAEFFLEWESFGQVRRENKKKITFYVSYFARKSRRLWNNLEKRGRARQPTDDNIIRRMRCAFWITKPTNTQSEYVIFIAFPRQKWLRERALLLRLYLTMFVLFVARVSTVPLNHTRFQILFRNN